MSDSDSDAIDEENLPSREECEERCRQFAAVTSTDSALAMFFLQDRQWDLQKALDAYFFENERPSSSSASEEKRKPNPLKKSDIGASSGASCSGLTKSNSEKRKHDGLEDMESSPKTKDKRLADDVHSVDLQPHRVRLITWNIDGLDKSNVVTRAEAVAHTILRERPDVVLLQEVIDDNLSVLKEQCPAYKIVLGLPEGTVGQCGAFSYYTAIMLNNATVQYLAHEVHPFTGSTMGRTLLTLMAKVKGVECMLMTSHLESTASHAAERKRQLKTAFDRMIAADKQQTVLFGGDLNLRDKELTGVTSIPAGMGDVWEDTGKRDEACYTWDLKRNDNLSWEFGNRPRCRFDRLYYRQRDRLRPVYLELVGLERIPGCRRFPSDHWGILAHFDIK